jgi:hypothetical protein
LLACALAALVVGHAVWAHVKLAAPARAARRRVDRAARGEAEALALCEREGYRVLAVQPEYAWGVEVDGEARQVRLRPDLLVERGGRRFVADVKTGGQAPDPLYPATRRQLLEYLLACGVDGVLVVDMEARQIRSLGFVLPGASSGFAAAGLGGLVVALLAGVAAGAAGMRLLGP